jgi:hypothetical protein
MLALSKRALSMSEEDSWGVREEEGRVNPLGGDNQHKAEAEGAFSCGDSSGDIHRDAEVQYMASVVETGVAAASGPSPGRPTGPTSRPALIMS